MAMKSGKGERRVPKMVLRLPDLDQAKSAVLNSLSAIDAQRGYRHAIEEFIEWYCSEPRRSFSKIVVLRYRIHLESRHLAPGTVNRSTGRAVAISELTREEQTVADKSIYHKNLLPVTYVTGDVAGVMESPVYAILKLGPRMNEFKAPAGYAIEQHMAALPIPPTAIP
jgi:hypothetical protein